MTEEDKIALSELYVDILVESNKFVHTKVMGDAIREALYGHKFPFEFVGQVSDLDKELEYISHANVPIGETTIRNIIKAYLNNTIQIAWEGQSKDKSKREMNRIRTLVGDKYKIERQKYVQ